MAARPATTVLVLGASGMLGRAVMKRLQREPEAYRVVGTGHSRAAALGLRPLDVSDHAALDALLAEVQPAVVINCVAERRPDWVDKDEARARELNVTLVERLAAGAAKQGFYLVHIGTDYVFDGSSPPYTPASPPNPLNAYGKSKLAAEEAIRQAPGLDPSAWLILRVPVLYGSYSSDLAESSITQLAKDVLAADRPKKVDDWAARTPTHTADVAEVLCRIVARRLQQGGPGITGIQHFSSKERASPGGPWFTKYSISQMIGEILGVPTDHLSPDPNPPAGGAPRPKDCELDTSGLVAALGGDPLPHPLPPLREGLSAALKQML